MIKFEKVTKFKEVDFPMPKRATESAAGYDMACAKDIIIPSYLSLIGAMSLAVSMEEADKGAFTIEQMSQLTKETGMKPTLVPLGVKCYLPKDKFLGLYVRSSCPLKNWLIMANSVGIIDADYADNPGNEGEIFAQIINLSPFDIKISKGEIVVQGIIQDFHLTDDDHLTDKESRIGGHGSTTK